MVKNASANIGEEQVQSLGWKDPLEEEITLQSKTGLIPVPAI